MSTKTIVLFNHKGGVSKTTSTYNIAWKLTDLNKKVLLVDGDPQCNLSSLIIGDNFEEFYEDERTKFNNIKDAVKVAFEGKPKPISSIDCVTPPANSNLFLIPGHPNLSEYDPSLSLAMNSNNAITTLQNLPGAFEELIKLTCAKYNVDYVFIDMNPGLSSLNQAFVMSADGFIIPTNPDPFSIMAIRTLKSILPRWKQWAKNSSQLFKDASYPIPEKEIKYIGHLIQRFSLRKGKAARPYQDRISEINKTIEEELVPELRNHNMLVDDDKLQSNDIHNHCLAEISEFGALLQKSHEHSIPVFSLSDAQLSSTGPILEQLIASRERFNNIFLKIANTIISCV
ncbi:ParA family protein [Leptospira stimsonii]|uniref:Chromosome partitioning protein ParA n=1 Tax=Leptospira stimsonii TaxID=2202203 RepID=A0A396Z6W7_9LEPT|nr:AAA family ATPase [Leptospira stimsonii]RHX89436.1 chromosome partitioning protein ParA [Leptospira stimsonii]